MKRSLVLSLLALVITTAVQARPYWKGNTSHLNDSSEGHYFGQIIDAEYPAIPTEHGQLLVENKTKGAVDIYLTGAANLEYRYIATIQPKKKMLFSNLQSNAIYSAGANVAGSPPSARFDFGPAGIFPVKRYFWTLKP